MSEVLKPLKIRKHTCMKCEKTFPMDVFKEIYKGTPVWTTSHTECGEEYRGYTWDVTDPKALKDIDQLFDALAPGKKINNPNFNR